MKKYILFLLLAPMAVCAMNQEAIQELRELFNEVKDDDSLEHRVQVAEQIIGAVTPEISSELDANEQLSVEQKAIHGLMFDAEKLKRESEEAMASEGFAQEAGNVWIHEQPADHQELAPAHGEQVFNPFTPYSDEFANLFEDDD